MVKLVKDEGRGKDGFKVCAKSDLGPPSAARNGGFAEAAHRAHAGLVIAAVWDTIWIGREWAREVRGPCLLHWPSVTHVC